MNDGAGSEVRQEVREARLQEVPGTGQRGARQGSKNTRAQVNRRDSKVVGHVFLPADRARGACDSAQNSPTAPTKARIRSGFMAAELKSGGW